MKKPFGISMSDDVAEYVDGEANKVGISRSLMIERIVLEYKVLKRMNMVYSSNPASCEVTATKIIIPAPLDDSPAEPEKDAISEALNSSISDIFNNMK